jgi:hypothetical protein
MQREPFTKDSRRPGLRVLLKSTGHLTDDDLVRIFETMCKDRPWLDRLAVLEDGPTVQIVDRYAEHPWEFVTVVAIVPHDNSETNDEVVVSLQDGSRGASTAIRSVLRCCTSEREARMPTNSGRLH